jgi:hypothetical protein
MCLEMKLNNYTLSSTNNRYKISTFLKAYRKVSVYRVILILSRIMPFKKKTNSKINGKEPSLK